MRTAFAAIFRQVPRDARLPAPSEFHAAPSLGERCCENPGAAGQTERRVQRLAETPPFAMMRAAAGRPSSGCASAGAPVAELVDAPDSKSGGFTSVLVRVRPGAPCNLCRITITTPTPTRQFPRDSARTPQPVLDDAETPSAAMRSRLDLQRLERSGSPARFLNRARSILFRKHFSAGRVLLQRRDRAR
jgi:hypothetical protein